jgi:hypothetical protein
MAPPPPSVGYSGSVRSIEHRAADIDAGCDQSGWHALLIEDWVPGRTGYCFQADHSTIICNSTRRDWTVALSARRPRPAPQRRLE